MKRFISLTLSLVMVLSMIIVVPSASASETASGSTPLSSAMTDISDIDFSSADLQKVYFKVETDKDFTTYAVGEAIIFTATLWADMDTDSVRHNDTQLTAPYFYYNLQQDDGNDTEGYIDATSGTVTLETTLTCAGSVHLHLEPADANKNLIVNSKITKFNGGASANASEIDVTTTKPTDFEEFWKEQIADLDKVDPNLVEIIEINEKEGFKAYEVHVACVDDTSLTTPGTGTTYLSASIAFPENASLNELGIDMTFQGYGVSAARPYYQSGYITMHISAHSIPVNNEDSYYSDLQNGALKNYGWDLTKEVEAGTEPTAENSYFRNLLLRDLQAVRFLLKYFGADGGPVATGEGSSVDTSAWANLWDGSRLEMRGGSQGGFQQIAVAALDAIAGNNRITSISPGVPWFADIAVDPEGKRIESVFLPNYHEQLSYYDTAFFAQYVNVPYVYVSAGAGDTTCPLSGVQAIYNNLSSEVDIKVMRVRQGMGHGSTESYPIDSLKSEIAPNVEKPGGYACTDYNLGTSSAPNYVKNTNGEYNDILWELDPNTLTLTFKPSENGTSTELIVDDGYVEDWVTYAPWYSYKNIIKRIVISEGITSISGYRIFGDYTALEEVILETDKIETNITQSLFDGCTALTSIGHKDTIKENTYDLRNFIWKKGNSDKFFVGCGGGNEIEVLLPYADMPSFGCNSSGALRYYADNFSNAKSVTFNVVYGSTADEIAQLYVTNAADRFSVKEYPSNIFAVKSSGSYSGTVGGIDTAYSWKIYENGLLEVESTSGGIIGPELSVSIATVSGDGNVGSSGGESTLQNAVTKINLIGFNTLYIDSTASGGNSPLSNVNGYGFPNLSEVDLGTVTTHKLGGGNRGLFQACKNLKTVYAGEDNRKAGVVDLSCITAVDGTSSNNDSFARMFINCSSVESIILPDVSPVLFGQAVFSGCSSLKSVTIPSGYTKINAADMFKNCSALEKIIFEEETIDITGTFSLPSNVTSVVCYSEDIKTVLSGKGISADIISVEKRPVTQIASGTYTGKVVSWEDEGEYSWILYSDGVLEVTSVSLDTVGYELWNTAVSKDLWEQVKSLKLVGFKKVYHEGYKTPFTYVNSEGFANLEEVDLGSVTTLYMGTTQGTRGLFHGSAKLKTVYAGEDNRKENTVDLSAITTIEGNGLGRIFYNCSSIKNVILPGASPSVFEKDSFANCSSLESVTFPVGFNAINGDLNLSSCASLKTLTFESSALSISGTVSLPSNLASVICYSQNVKDALIAKAVPEAKIIFIGGTIKADGFMVRTNKTSTSVNGLRTLYTFDAARRDELVSSGLTFKEFGTILVAASKLGDSTLELTWNGTEYAVNVKGAVKVPVLVGDDQVGRLLEDQDGNPDTLEFAATLVNFKANFNSDVYSCGYSIFEDTATGETYIEYVNYGDAEGKEAWKLVNIFEVAYGMYTNTDDEGYGDLMNIQTDEESVWGILGVNSINLEETSREITFDGISIMISGDTLFVRRMDGDAPTAGDISAAETKATDLQKTYTKTVGIKVTDDPEFTVKSEWEQYVDMQIALSGLTEEEKERSFIFVTDTHWNENSKNSSVENNVTNVLKYTSEALGDALVIHGGDLYGGFYKKASDAYPDGNEHYYRELALRVVDDYFVGELESNFGGNYLYALGNHDPNTIAMGKVNDSASTDYYHADLTLDQMRENFLISDTEMYEHTVGLIDKGGMEIKYDTDSIAKIREIMSTTVYEATGEVYSEEYIKEAEALMKMHYHYDDPSRNIRFIVVDTGGGGPTHGRALGGWATRFVAHEYKWLAETLAGTPEGYDVVVVGHEIADPKEYVPDTEFTSSEALQGIYDIISAFKLGGKVTTTVNAGHAAKGAACGKMLEYAKLTDFDFETAFDGNVITLAGHVHNDHAWYVNSDGIITNNESKNVSTGSLESANSGAVLAIVTGTTNYMSVNPIDQRADGVNMSNKMPDNVRFDIVTIKEDGSVQLTRIGAGESRYFAYNKK